MHFKLLVTVEIPAISEDEVKNQEIQNVIKELEQKKSEEPKNLMVQVLPEEFHGKIKTFSRAIYKSVADVMEPYCEEPYDSKYIEFLDCTERLKTNFSKKVDCLRLAEGRIVEYCSYPYYHLYSIRDGKVFQREAGPLKHEKRTKEAKRIEVLSEYPREKLYESFEEYVEDYLGFDFDTEHEAYGYYYNPNAMWDWYQIGGRWPGMFLVKDSCTEYLSGERSWCNEDKKLEAPEGYIRVSAARKKDIEWQVMRNWINDKTSRRFDKLERMFVSGQLDADFKGKIVEDGILQWGTYIYHKGDTSEIYLEKYGIPKSWKYPIGVHDIADARLWKSQNKSIHASDSEDLSAAWRGCLDGYIDALDNDTVLVGVDYHM